MEPIPLPSHIHYELVLQLLERQTMFAVNRSAVQEQVHQLIITLRKAMAQQKQLEESCQRHQLPIEYRWSLNDLSKDQPTSATAYSLLGEPHSLKNASDLSATVDP